MPTRVEWHEPKEETFRLLDDGQWAPMEDTGGVLIMPDQIVSIEFRKTISEVSDE